MAKNLVGSGILSLPVGVAAFASSPKALVPALAVLVVAALLSAYTFFLIGRVCDETRTETFGSAWQRSFRRGAWAPRLVCVLECLGGSVVYAMILGDVFSSVLRLCLPATAAARVLAARSTVILTMGAVVLYPLCCLRSFAQLARFSLLGTLATTYVVLFVVKRFLDGSYAPGGAFFQAPPSVLQVPQAFNVLILVSILSTAFLVHFNAPQMFVELTPGGHVACTQERDKKRLRFARVALAGFSIAGIQYALIMVFGFLTFGGATQGNVLMNYASSDALAIVARLAIGVSTLFGYPMQFAGLRSGFLEAFGKAPDLPRVKHRLLTAGLLLGVLGGACVVQDLGRFQAIEGALLASFLIYIAPPLMAFQLWGGRLAKLRFLLLVAVGVAAGTVSTVVTMR